MSNVIPPKTQRFLVATNVASCLTYVKMKLLQTLISRVHGSLFRISANWRFVNEIARSWICKRKGLVSGFSKMSKSC